MHYRWIDGDLLLKLRVTPRASRDHLGPLQGDRLKVAITAPPVEGKANAYLTKFLAKRLGLPRSRVEVIRGASSRNKTVRIRAPRRVPGEFEVPPCS